MCLLRLDIWVPFNFLQLCSYSVNYGEELQCTHQVLAGSFCFLGYYGVHLKMHQQCICCKECKQMDNSHFSVSLCPIFTIHGKQCTSYCFLILGKVPSGIGRFINRKKDVKERNHKLVNHYLSWSGSHRYNKPAYLQLVKQAEFK